jgi:hypothetical protein
MNNTFRITISAVDKATAVVRSVKNSFAKITRPVADLKSVVTSLGKETGLDKVGKSILTIGDATSVLASKMSGVFPALGGGLGIAAMAALAGSWGNLGSEINKTSRVLDISTGQFQEFQAVARRSDVSAESFTGGLKSLSSTMEDVFYHRASPEAITALRQMGIQFHQTASGAPDLVRGVMDIADATKRLQGNSQAQRKLLESLGLSEDLLPIFSKGAVGIRELSEEFRKTHGMISDGDIRRADAFKDSMINLGDALAGVGTRLIANTGDLTDFNNAMAQWIGGGPNPFKGLGTAEESTALKHDAPAVHLFWGAELVNAWWKAIADPNTQAPGGEVQGPPLPPHISNAKLSIPNPPAPAGIYINSPAPPEITGPAPSVNAVTNSAAALSPKLSIELIMKNAPPGMTAKIKTSDGSQIPVRVETSMPTTTMP